MAHHSGHDLMATDDVVAPRVKRVTAGKVFATGLAVMVIALLGILVGLQRQATFSTQDRAQIRQIIDERKVQRDTQQAQVRLQLDEQARVLCVVVMDFRQRAQTARARVTLDRAIRDLDCARVLRVPPKR
jgi:cell division protein FtsL